MNTEAMNKKNHGRNVKRIREIVGMKQEALAAELGVGQQRMSAIEQKEEIEDELMEQIARILKVPAEAIRNFDEEKAVNIISNTFHDSAVGNVYFPTLNPIDKWIEALKKNEELYERLLKTEREKNELLQNLLKENKA
jgi:transcriptional regulator with XRE-family HTH domain